MTDGGNGLEEALRRQSAANLTTTLDWYHAAEHLCDFAKVWLSHDETAREAWRHEVTYRQLQRALTADAESPRGKRGGRDE